MSTIAKLSTSRKAKFSSRKPPKISTKLRGKPPKTPKLTRMLSFDPGKANFAFASLTTKPSLECAGLLNCPIGSLKVNEQKKMLEGFTKEVSKLLNRTRPDMIALERLPGGRTGGSRGELVNIMIGILIHIAMTMRIDRIVLVTSGEWKPALRRKYSIRDLHAMFPQTKEHILDAMYIGIYILERDLGVKMFNKIITKKQLKTIDG